MKGRNYNDKGIYTDHPISDTYEKCYINNSGDNNMNFVNMLLHYKNN